jgi:hypothetical protein
MKDVSLVALVVLSLAAGGAEAKPKPAPPPADGAAPVSEVEELMVAPEAACLAPKLDRFAPKPKIVSTFPKDGDTVRPGILILRVTFDQPMSCKGFFTAIPKLKTPCPGGQQQWVESFDRRTVRTVCHAEGNVLYGIGVSDNPDATFLSLAGRPLDPFEFRFRTSIAPDVLTNGEALDEDPDSQAPKLEYVPLELKEAHVKK